MGRTTHRFHVGETSVSAGRNSKASRGEWWRYDPWLPRFSFSRPRGPGGRLFITVRQRWLNLSFGTGPLWFYVRINRVWFCVAGVYHVYTRRQKRWMKKNGYRIGGNNPYYEYSDREKRRQRRSYERRY